MEGPSYAERPPRADDDEQDALEERDPLRGPVFGNMVHEVLEQIDFSEVGKAADPAALLQPASPAAALIDEQVNLHLAEIPSRIPLEQLREACRKQIATLVWNGLQTPLSALGGPLWRISKPDRLHEIEFNFPERDGPPPPDLRREEGFLTGFMDLVFRKDGKYYLADWKTNDLHGRYAPEEVVQSMQECDYIRQYCLYLHALARWLKRVHGPAFDFTRDFGGVYYLFLRGMNGKDDTAGVFYRHPTKEDLRLDQILSD
jgi:ATP-dependent exoDNAse (exonuclease V) beta subunit